MNNHWNKRTANMKRYFKGLIDQRAEMLSSNGNWWQPGNELGQTYLYFEEKPDGFLHWCSGAYIPINKALFNWIAGYAAARGVPIAVEP
jgi:hypothetical protein